MLSTSNFIMKLIHLGSNCKYCLFSGVTFSSTGPITLQGDALFVVFDSQDSFLLCTRRLWRTPGQNHPDLPAVHIQVPALSHVHILKVKMLGKTAVLSIFVSGSHMWHKEGYVSVWERKRVTDFPVDRTLSIKVLLIELWGEKRVK